MTVESVTPRTRFEALDAWRGICALMVAAGHLKTSGHISAWGVIGNSYRFVDFFFVLSGFVIAHAYGARLREGAGQLTPFLIRRLGRLYPLHIVMLAGFIAYELAMAAAIRAGIDPGRDAFSEKTVLAWLPANLALVQAWGILPSASWNVPAWSISAEVAAYLVFALLCVGTGRRVVPLMATIGFVSLALLLFVAPLGMGSTYDFALARCLFGFSAGVLGQAIFVRLPAARLRHATAAELAMLIAVGAGVWWLPDAAGVLVVPLFTAAVLLFAREAGAISRILCSRPAIWLGQRSYSIYMVHALIMIVLLSAGAVTGGVGPVAYGKVGGKAGFVGPALAMDALILAYLATIIAVSALTFRWIEAPGRDWFNALARRRAQ